MSSIFRISRVLVGCSLTALLALAACSDQPAAPVVDGILLAPGGGGPPPKVNEADPPSAPQDTTLDVRVLGSNFAEGDTVEYTIDGVPQAQVRTNSVTFVSENELRSNITIDLDAEVDLYDVEVTSLRGKKGIGADKFAVTVKGGGPSSDPSITLEFVDDAANNIQSDARGQYGDGECGVQATFNLTDARLDPAAKKIHPRDAGVCGGRDARKVRVAFTDRMDGSPPNGQDGNTVDAGFFKVNEVEQVTEADGTVARTVVVHGPGCALGVRFNPNLDPQSDAVEVTKNADGTWTVRTKPFPDNVAVCLPDEGAPNPPPRSYYYMSFEVTVRLQ